MDDIMFIGIFVVALLALCVILYSLKTARNTEVGLILPWFRFFLRSRK